MILAQVSDFQLPHRILTPSGAERKMYKLRSPGKAGGSPWVARQIQMVSAIASGGVPLPWDARALRARVKGS